MLTSLFDFLVGLSTFFPSSVFPPSSFPPVVVLLNTPPFPPITLSLLLPLYLFPFPPVASPADEPFVREMSLRPMGFILRDFLASCEGAGRVSIQSGTGQPEERMTLTMLKATKR